MDAEVSALAYVIDLTAEKDAEALPMGAPTRRAVPSVVIDLCESSDSDTSPPKKKQRTQGAFQAARGDPPPQQQCPICLEEIEPAFQHSLVGCQHPFCLGCLRGYVSGKVADRTFPVNCPLPGCGGAISTVECGLVLNPEEQDVLGQLEAESAIPNPQRVYCPHAACSHLLLLEGEPPRDQEMQCPYCKQGICTHCKVPWHKGLSCQQYKDLPDNMRGAEDRAMLELAGQFRWKQCPKCRNMVERVSGCNAMRCRCGNAFCYECGLQLKQCQCQATRGHMPLGRAEGVGLPGGGFPLFWFGGEGAPPGWENGGMPGERLDFPRAPFLGFFRHFLEWLPGGPPPPALLHAPGLHAPYPRGGGRGLGGPWRAGGARGGELPQPRRRRARQEQDREGAAGTAAPAAQPPSANGAEEQEAAREGRRARRDQLRGDVTSELGGEADSAQAAGAAGTAARVQEPRGLGHPFSVGMRQRRRNRLAAAGAPLVDGSAAAASAAAAAHPAGSDLTHQVAPGRGSGADSGQVQAGAAPAARAGVGPAQGPGHHWQRRRRQAGEAEAGWGVEQQGWGPGSGRPGARRRGRDWWLEEGGEELDEAMLEEAAAWEM